MVIQILGYKKGSNPPPILKRKVEFSLYFKDGSSIGEFNNQSVLPLVLVFSNMAVVVVIVINTLVNKFRPSFKISIFPVLFYFLVLAGLVYFCIAFNVAAGSGD